MAGRCLASRFTGIVLTLGLVSALLVASGHTGSTATPTTEKTVPPLQTTLRTSDGILLLRLSITPNRLGQNTFLIDVQSTRSNKPVTNEEVQIFTTMLDMDMGTGVILFQSDGNGRYSAQANLPMDGNWEIHIQLIDDFAVHIAKLQMYVSA